MKSQDATSTPPRHSSFGIRQVLGFENTVIPNCDHRTFQITVTRDHKAGGRVDDSDLRLRHHKDPRMHLSCQVPFARNPANCEYPETFRVGRDRNWPATLARCQSLDALVDEQPFSAGKPLLPLLISVLITLVLVEAHRAAGTPCSKHGYALPSLDPAFGGGPS